MENETAMPGNWFVVITMDILTSSELNDKQKILLALISNLQGQRGYCYAGNQYMADKLSCSTSAIKESLRFLVNAGWLKRDIFYNESGQVSIRSLEVIMKKCHAPFQEFCPPPAGNPAYPPPTGIPAYPTGIPADPYRNSGTIITNINKEGKEEIGKKNSSADLPTLEEILKYSAAAKNDQIWWERSCLTFRLKKDTLFSWMDIFDLHISQTEEVRGVTERKYKNLFAGWLRMKRADGKRIEDYQTTQSNDDGEKTRKGEQGSGKTNFRDNGKNEDNSGRHIEFDEP